MTILATSTAPAQPTMPIGIWVEHLAQPTMPFGIWVERQAQPTMPCGIWVERKLVRAPVALTNFVLHFALQFTQHALSAPLGLYSLTIPPCSGPPQSDASLGLYSLTIPPGGGLCSGALIPSTHQRKGGGAGRR